MDSPLRVMVMDFIRSKRLADAGRDSQGLCEPFEPGIRCYKAGMTMLDKFLSFARRLPAATVRATVVLTGLVMAAVFFLRH